ncbi:benenodin family lasso peptide [Novosphingobium sp. G106]|nr:benenodin family lasso peptide [Novosphingobium sp. G106]MBV1691394.1 benenodin family lasso peptide [Novosphingobium sp. G106]
MEREHDTAEVIELGTASAETKGVLGQKTDQGFNLIPQGMTDD